MYGTTVVTAGSLGESGWGGPRIGWIRADGEAGGTVAFRPVPVRRPRPYGARPIGGTRWGVQDKKCVARYLTRAGGHGFARWVVRNPQGRGGTVRSGCARVRPALSGVRAGRRMQ
ncbi:hypothetical protein CP973_23670 [Streptomyces albofaciens JCM 4342]|nr:hypothetical protein CP973_23670 [Streptomyces albofaciens JCM 4342]